MSAEIVEWIDPLNVVTVLDVEWDTVGRYMPGIEWEEEGVPDQPGMRLRSVRHGVHEFMLPVWLESTSETALRTAMRSLLYKMDPVRGAGKIRVTSPLGDQREIICRYASGLEMDEKLGDTSAPLAQRIPIKFKAHDPYYYDVNSIQSSYTTTAGPSFFPFFTLNLNASEVVGTVNITNTGDVETWPVWTIRGPGSIITINNTTTGRLTTINYSLATGLVLTIDTRPGIKTLSLVDGTNIFPYLATGTGLWPLVVGNNNLTISMSGSDSNSLIQLAYWRRWLGP